MPNTKVYLLNVPLDIELNHTYYFDSKEEQKSFFLTKVKHTYDDCTYQRKDGKIRVPDHFDNVVDSNYVMYVNEDYSNKVYYAFIKDIVYVDDGRTDIYIETDPLQTYLNEYTVGTCFVEREHVSDDTIGLHTIPENLETGEYKCNTVYKDNNLNEFVYVLHVTEYYRVVEEGEQIIYGEDHEYSDIQITSMFKDSSVATNVGGIPIAGSLLIFETYKGLANYCKIYDKKGKGEAIIGAYMIPKNMIVHSYTKREYSGQEKPNEYEILISKPDNNNGYKPKNNKLLTFPYTYLIMSNNNGNSNILKFEAFDNETSATFKVKGIPVVGGSIKCNPTQYNNVAENQEEGIICGKFPVLSWSSDLYLNWLTQNSLNNTIGIASGVASIVAGVVSGGAIGGAIALGGVSSIAGVMGKSYEKSFTPDSAKGNTNGGDILTASKNNNMFFYTMSIKQEYAKIIDDYFTMFGYKVSDVKVPNKNHRPFYWFTKTIGANITGSIPQSELKRIRSVYDNGVTFWKSTSQFRNYNLNNSIN